MNWKQPLFYRTQRRWVDLEALFSFLSIALILMAVARASSQSQSVLTMQPLMTGSWVMMVMATGVNNWMKRSMPANSVSKAEGGTL